jgi:hypothetical protein
MKNFVGALVMGIMLTSCSGGIVESTNSVVSSKETKSYADSLAPLFSDLQKSLDYNFDPRNRWSLNGSLPYFRPGNALLQFDPDYNSLNVSSTVFLNENSEWDTGETTAIKFEDSGLPSATGWEIVCAKNAIRDLAAMVLEGMELWEVPKPKESLRLQITFTNDYVLKKGKKDKFGNIEGTVTEEREQVLMVHMSRKTIDKISPRDVDNFFVISDVEKPISPPSRWANCKRYALN